MEDWARDHVVHQCVLSVLGPRARAVARAVCKPWKAALADLPYPVQAQTVPAERALAFPRLVSSVTWSPDGEKVAVVFTGAVVRVFYVATPRPLDEIRLPAINQYSDHAVAWDTHFSPDATALFVVYCDRGRVFVRMQSLEDPSHVVDHAALPHASDDGNVFMVPRPTAQAFRVANWVNRDYSGRCIAYLWEKRGSEVWQRLHTWNLRADTLPMWFSQDGAHMAMSQLKFRDNDQHTERLTVVALDPVVSLSTISHPHGIEGLAFSDAGRLVTTLDRRGRAHEYRVATGALLRQWAGVDCFAKWDGLFGGVAILFRDGRVALNGAEGRAPVEGLGPAPRQAAMSPDGRALLVGDEGDAYREGANARLRVILLG